MVILVQAVYGVTGTKEVCPGHQQPVVGNLPEGRQQYGILYFLLRDI